LFFPPMKCWRNSSGAAILTVTLLIFGSVCGWTVMVGLIQIAWLTSPSAKCAASSTLKLALFLGTLNLAGVARAYAWQGLSKAVCSLLGIRRLPGWKQVFKLQHWNGLELY
jgi:hypothetical protein